MADQTAVLLESGQAATIGDISFDCTVTERHSSRASVTSYPIEELKGSDHVVQELDEVSLGGIFTDTPSGAERASVGRSRDLYLDLIELKERGATLDVVTNLRVYQNMVITAVDAVKDPTTGYSVPVNVSLQPVRIARTRSTVIPSDEIDDSVRHSAGDEVDDGRQSGRTPGDSTAERGSFLHGLIFGGD